MGDVGNSFWGCSQTVITDVILEVIPNGVIFFRGTQTAMDDFQPSNFGGLG